MRQSVLSSGNSKSNKKTKRIAKGDSGAVVRREFGELFESLHDRLVRVEKILCLLPSDVEAVKRIEELTGAKSRNKAEAGLQGSANRSPYF